jgi:hypothetical protein
VADEHALCGRGTPAGGRGPGSLTREPGGPPDRAVTVSDAEHATPLMAAGEAEVQFGVSRPSDHSLRRRVARRRSTANRSLSGISRPENKQRCTTNVLSATPCLTRSAASQKLRSALAAGALVLTLL